MSTLVKINPVVYNDVHSLRRLYNEIESHVHSLLTLDIDVQHYGSMAVCKSTVWATVTTQLYNKANNKIFKFRCFVKEKIMINILERFHSI